MWQNGRVMANLPKGGCMTPVSITWDLWDPLGFHLSQKVLKSGKKRLSCGQFTNGRLLTPVSIVWDVWDPFGLHLNQKDQISGKNNWVTANLPMGGCVTQVSVMQDVWDSLGLHWNKKDLKWGRKRLSYGQFTNGRLRDSSEYHAGCMGLIRALLEPKKSEIGQ